MQESAIRFVRRPSPRLHRSTQLQCQFVEIAFPLVFGNSSFVHQPPKISVGADIVKAMVMDSEMADVGSHSLYRRRTPQIAELLFAGSVKLQDVRSVLKPLCPLGPSTARILALHR